MENSYAFQSYHAFKVLLEDVSSMVSCYRLLLGAKILFGFALMLFRNVMSYNSVFLHNSLIVIDTTIQ